MRLRFCSWMTLRVEVGAGMVQWQIMYVLKVYTVGNGDVKLMHIFSS